MQTRCRYFNGYKPCGRSERCTAECSDYQPWGFSVLIVHLGAMGAVLRSTALLPAILRRYPGAQVTWVTENPMPALLRTHPALHQVLGTSSEDLLSLRAREFDVAFVIDKSAKAAGVLATTKARKVFGFTLDSQFGFVRPANSSAEELWHLGLSNHAKFFVNRKTENQLVHEALELGEYRRDPYSLILTKEEERQAEVRRQEWSVDRDQVLIGLNTGCGPLMPAKKWTVEFHRRLVVECHRRGMRNLVLLGGPEDEERNRAIATGRPVHSSPVGMGIRDGAVSVAACDLVITGDSFGMHLAIALKKYVIAWFGPSCAHEIELYGRGEKLQAQVNCSPCWKRACHKDRMCFDAVPIEEVCAALQRGIDDLGKCGASSDGAYASDKPHANLGL